MRSFGAGFAVFLTKDSLLFVQRQVCQWKNGKFETTNLSILSVTA